MTALSKFASTYVSAKLGFESANQNITELREFIGNKLQINYRNYLLLKITYRLFDFKEKEKRNNE